MQHYDKILELRQLQVREAELKGELRRFVQEKAQADRKFADGEKVTILDAKGIVKGEGFIAGAFIIIGLDYDIKKYSDDESRWLRDITEIRYTVMGIKKDGTASSRTAFGNKSYTATPPKNEWQDHYYIIKQP